MKLTKIYAIKVITHATKLKMPKVGTTVEESLDLAEVVPVDPVDVTELLAAEVVAEAVEEALEAVEAVEAVELAPVPVLEATVVVVADEEASVVDDVGANTLGSVTAQSAPIQPGRQVQVPSPDESTLQTPLSLEQFAGQ